MGCQSSKNETEIEVKIEPEHIELARQSWNSLLDKDDLASHGLNMVIK